MAFLFYSSKLYIIKLKKIPKYDKFNIGAKPRKVFNMEERNDKTIICKDCGKEWVCAPVVRVSSQKQGCPKCTLEK